MSNKDTELVARSALSAVVLIAAVVGMAKFGLAVTTVAVSPSTFTLGDTTTVVTVQANAAAAGNSLIYDIHIDADGDGNLDPQDGRFMSFEIADGQAPHLGNVDYWHDSDGAVNSSVRVVLSQYGSWWFSGHFIVKVTDENASTAKASFTVVQDSFYPCIITGEVQSGGSPAAGAIVQITEMATERELSMAVAGADGAFELRVEQPGQYGVYAMQVGSVTRYDEGSAQILDAVAGTNSLPGPLVVFPGNRAISGTVVGEDTGQGLRGKLVFGDADGLFALAVADDDGGYALAVTDGLWEEVSPQNEQISRAGYVPPVGQAITVSGSNVANVDFSCQKATTLITGTVKDAETMQGLQGFSIDAETGEGENRPEVLAYTGPDGIYKIGVIAGDWQVQLEEDRLLLTGYARPSSQHVTAPASGTVSGVDFILEKAGTITGHVYEGDGVTPIEGAKITAFELTTGVPAADAGSGPDGSYSLSLPSGTYKVKAFGVQGRLDQLYYKVLLWEDALPVAVSAPSETTGIDFVLVPAAYITGHVYQEDGVTPIDGAFVDASVFGPGWDWAASGETGPDGSYGLTLPPGAYKVLCRGVPGWFNQYYNRVSSDDQATPVNAVGGEETTGVDFVLERAATISGHVYEEDGASPIPWAEVFAVEATTGQWVGAPLTGHDGSYSVSVPSGSYRLWAQASGWVGEYYDDAHSYQQAAVITVVAPEEKSEIDFALTESSATIKGHVYREDGITPIPGASVTALEYATDNAVGWTQAGTDGSYTLPVPPGVFKVNGWAHHYALQYYDHRQHHDATPVTVSGSQVVENIDFELPWIPFVVHTIQKCAAFPGVEVKWWWVPGMRYSVYWTDALHAAGTSWHEVPDPTPDIVKEGSNGGWMTWTDKGTSPGMNGHLPGDPSVRSRYYRVGEEPE